MAKTGDGEVAAAGDSNSNDNRHPTRCTAVPTPAPPPPRAPQPPSGDLGLRTPMSRPACNGQAIVILGYVTTPGQYARAYNVY